MTTDLLSHQRNYANVRGMKTLARIALFAGAFLLLTYTIYLFPPRVDWDVVFYPVLRAADPYQVQGFFNPPWLFIVLWPFGLLPSHVGGSLWMALCVVGILYAGRRMGADMWSYLCVFISAPFMWWLGQGNIDILILLGMFIYPPAAGILVLLIKPQVLGTAVLFRLKEATVIDLIAIAAVFIWSLALYGLWPLDVYRAIEAGGLGHPFNLAILWPWGIPAGLALLAYAWRHKDVALGGLSIFFLTPYLSPASIMVYIVILFSRLRGWQRVAAYAAMTAVTVVLYG